MNDDIHHLKVLVASRLTPETAKPLLDSLDRIETIQAVKNEFEDMPDDLRTNEKIQQLADKYNKSTSTIEKYLWVEWPVFNSGRNE